MAVYSVSWNAEDYVSELRKILEDCSVPDLEAQFVQYVVEFIEPAGWRAVWRPDALRNPPGALLYKNPKYSDGGYIVEVHDVSMDKLEAEVTVLCSVAEMKETFADENNLIKQDVNVLGNEKKKRKPSSSIVDKAKVSHRNWDNLKDITKFDIGEDLEMECDPSNINAESVQEIEFPINKSATSSLTDEKVNENVDDLRAKHMTVRLWELTPMVQQGEAVDVETTAEVIELIRFFYHHIYYPWDVEEDYCYYDLTTLKDRYHLYEQLNNKAPGIPRGVGVDMRRVLRDAWVAHSEIRQLEDKVGSSYDDVEVPQEAVQRLMRLHCRLEKLKERLRTLRDPVLREFATSWTLEQDIDIACNGNNSDTSCSPKGAVGTFSDTASSLGLKVHNKIWLVSRGLVSLGLLRTLMEEAETMLASQYLRAASYPVSVAPSLQFATECCVAGDVLLLTPDTYTVTGLGRLAEGGGAVIGLGEGAVLEGSSDTGDVMLCVTARDLSAPLAVDSSAIVESGEFVLHNVTLRPQACQIGVMIDSLSARLHKVTVHGECEGGLLITYKDDRLSKGEGSAQSVHVESCLITNCSGAGVDVRGTADVTLMNTTLENCGTGATFEQPTMVTLSDCVVKMCRIGLLGTIPNSSSSSITDMEIKSHLGFTNNVSFINNVKDCEVVECKEGSGESCSPVAS